MSRFGVATALSCAGLAAWVSWSTAALAQKVTLNPSDQTENSVSGGGNEAQYALINAKLAEAILDAAGFDARVDQDFYNAPANANSWGADTFVSIHTNAGGGHGIETLWVSSAGEVLAGHVQDGLLSSLPYQTRGLKYRDNLHVLNATNMPACLTEALFHDCSASSGYQGHPPSESEFLRSANGQQAIAAGIAQGVCTHYGKTCGTQPPPQKGWLRGVVYRAPNLGDLVEGASVQVQAGASSTTGADGAFAFELDPGTYTVTATFTGFLPGASTRDVVAGQDIWGSIGLEPEEALPDAEAPIDATAGWDAREASAPDASDAAPAVYAMQSEDPSGCACHMRGRSKDRFEWAWLSVLALGAGLAIRRRRAA